MRCSPSLATIILVGACSLASCSAHLEISLLAPMEVPTKPMVVQEQTTTAIAEAVQQTKSGSFNDDEPSTGVIFGLLGLLLAIIGIGATIYYGKKANR